MSGEGQKQISWVDGCAMTGGTIGRGSGGVGDEGSRVRGSSS